MSDMVICHCDLVLLHLLVSSGEQGLTTELEKSVRGAHCLRPALALREITGMHVNDQTLYKEL